MTDVLNPKPVLALSGGVGGAKLALGLASVLMPGQLAVVANTGDDFEHLGLPISPDLDTLMYTLAGIANPAEGWGRVGESWKTMDTLAELGGESWFRLGDLDLATHLYRAGQLAQGKTLSEVTSQLCEQLNIASAILPMSDDPVRTYVETDRGALPFQHYFVRERCQPAVKSVEFRGQTLALANKRWLALLNNPDLQAIIICPSNPFVSIDPMLGLPAVCDALRASAAPVIAVSPIVAGASIKGPSAKMMAEMQMPVSAAQVAQYYENRYPGLIDGFVVDTADGDEAGHIDTEVLVTGTVMKTLDDKKALACAVLEFAERLAAKSRQQMAVKCSGTSP
ncbi:MAG: 2-phospho-L-lactate transferase [Porticoccaceae bacterium]